MRRFYKESELRISLSSGLVKQRREQSVDWRRGFAIGLLGDVWHWNLTGYSATGFQSALCVSGLWKHPSLLRTKRPLNEMSYMMFKYGFQRGRRGKRPPLIKMFFSWASALSAKLFSAYLLCCCAISALLENGIARATVACQTNVQYRVIDSLVNNLWKELASTWTLTYLSFSPFGNTSKTLLVSRTVVSGAESEWEHSWRASNLTWVLFSRNH